MDNNSNTGSPYPDLLGNSYPDNLKVAPLEMNYPGGNNYLESMNNILTEDGIFTLGEEDNRTPPFMNYRTPSPMLGGQQEYYAQPPMMATPNNNVDSSQDYHTLEPQLPGNQLPRELQDIIRSIFDEDSSPFPEYDLSLDIGADAMVLNDDDDLILNDHIQPPIDSASAIHETRSPLPAGAFALPQPTQERRQRPRKMKSNSTLPDEAIPSLSPPPYGQYPRPEDLGVPSPTTSTYSDAGSSNDEGCKPRKRIPRVSFSNLTEEEKCIRIRDLNKKASKIYRERKHRRLSQKEQELLSLLEQNEHLTEKAEAFQKLRDQMQHYYTNTFLKHVQ